jgi:CRISPR/Cas system-associated exonuclease Cas4 (RecB family)
MVKIPMAVDPTIQALKKQEKEAAAKQPSRGYLGASLIGDACARKIWYTYQGYERKPFSAETLWKFADGHRTEDLIAERLRSLPFIELHTHDENGFQFGFSDFDGKFKGHCDGFIKGILQAPNVWHVWECKASEKKKYDEFTKLVTTMDTKRVLKKWNENYYAQAQLYMHYFKIDRHYTTVAKAGGRDIMTCRTEYEPEIAEYYRDRAWQIINATQEPMRISDKPDFWLCRFCDFSEVCHGSN